MAYYLSRYRGSGTEADPFQPTGADVSSFNSVDVRPDSSVVDGWAFLWVPGQIPRHPDVIDLGDDPNLPVSNRIANQIGRSLKLTIGNRDSLGDVLGEILVSHVRPLRFQRRLRRDPDDGTRTVRYRGIYLGPPGQRIWEQFARDGPGTTFSDDFDRTDENLDVSANWVNEAFRSKFHKVVSNHVQPDSDGSDAHTTLAAAIGIGNDAYSQVVATAQQSEYIGVHTRSAVDDDLIIFYWRGTTEVWRIGKWVNDTFSVIAQTSGPSDFIAQLLRGESEGDDHEFFVAGVSKLTVTETDNSAGRVGVISRGVGSVLDNYEGGDLGAVATSLIWAPGRAMQPLLVQ